MSSPCRPPKRRPYRAPQGHIMPSPSPPGVASMRQHPGETDRGRPNTVVMELGTWTCNSVGRNLYDLLCIAKWAVRMGGILQDGSRRSTLMPCGFVVLPPSA